MDDRVLSVHKTREDAEKAMRKHGGEPNSMDQQGMRIVDVGPHGKSEIIEIFGKMTVRPKTASTKTAADKEVVFLDEKGRPFATLRDADSVFDMWKKHKWDFRIGEDIKTQVFHPRDFRGREVLEKLFGKKMTYDASMKMEFTKSEGPRVATRRGRM
jgi:hypothetical protein